MLVPTADASAATGLSEWELRRGFKEGKYPAILIGRGNRARRLRWDLDLLREAIRDLMSNNGGKDDDKTETSVHHNRPAQH